MPHPDRYGLGTIPDIGDAGTGYAAEINALLANLITSAENPYDVMRWGAVWDGDSHPLSEVYGSVGAALADYGAPGAFIDSLDLERDYVATQACVNENARADLPRGRGVWNAMLDYDTSGDIEGIRLTGEGAWLTEIDHRIQAGGPLINLDGGGVGGQYQQDTVLGRFRILSTISPDAAASGIYYRGLFHYDFLPTRIDSLGGDGLVNVNIETDLDGSSFGRIYNPDIRRCGGTAFRCLYADGIPFSSGAVEIIAPFFILNNKGIELFGLDWFIRLGQVAYNRHGGLHGPCIEDQTLFSVTVEQTEFDSNGDFNINIENGNDIHLHPKLISGTPIVAEPGGGSTITLPAGSPPVQVYMGSDDVDIGSSDAIHLVRPKVRADNGAVIEVARVGVNSNNARIEDARVLSGNPSLIDDHGNNTVVRHKGKVYGEGVHVITAHVGDDPATFLPELAPTFDADENGGAQVFHVIWDPGSANANVLAPLRPGNQNFGYDGLEVDFILENQTGGPLDIAFTAQGGDTWDAGGYAALADDASVSVRVRYDVTARKWRQIGDWSEPL